MALLEFKNGCIHTVHTVTNLRMDAIINSQQSINMKFTDIREGECQNEEQMKTRFRFLKKTIIAILCNF